MGVLPGVQGAETACLGMPGLVGFAGCELVLPADQVMGLRRLQLAADRACPRIAGDGRVPGLRFRADVIRDPGGQRFPEAGVAGRRDR